MNRNRISMGLVAFLTMAVVFWACGNDDDDDAVPSSIECDGVETDIGPFCQDVYAQVLACCVDEEIGTQAAIDLVCGMQANEDACEQGGSASADAQCSLLAMQPECTESGGDSDTDTDTDDDTDDDGFCEGECTEEEHMDAVCNGAGTVSCMCQAESVNYETQYLWIESSCIEGEWADWCTGEGYTPFCNPDSGTCECDMGD